MSLPPTLIVDTSFLGDVLCAEPLVRAVAARAEWGELDVLTSPGGAQMLTGHPRIRKLRVFDKRGDDRGWSGLWRLARQLREERYGRVFCTHRSWRTAALLWLARIPVRVGFHNASARWLYTEHVDYRKELHEIERNLQMVGGGDWEAPRMFPSDEEVRKAEARSPQAPFVALAPGSIWTTKRWPSARFSELLTGLLARGLRVVLIGGGEDRALAAEILTAAGVDADDERVRNTCGELNLRESYALLKGANALVTNDSAPMHMGVAAGIPVIAIYCSTLPEFGFAPRGARDQVLEVGGLGCRPCGIHGHPQCPEEHFRCGWETEAERVLAAVAAIGAGSGAE